MIAGRAWAELAAAMGAATARPRPAAAMTAFLTYACICFLHPCGSAAASHASGAARRTAPRIPVLTHRTGRPWTCWDGAGVETEATAGSAGAWSFCENCPHWGRVQPSGARAREVTVIVTLPPRDSSTHP